MGHITVALVSEFQLMQESLPQSLRPAEPPLSPFRLAPFTKPLRVRNTDFVAKRRQV